MSQLAADRNLLFGILAMQLDFIAREELVAAMNAWVLAKDQALGALLVRHGALSAARRALLESLVEEHLQQHGGDARRSLAALPSATASVNLAGIADADVQASLASVASHHATTPADAPLGTAPYSPPRDMPPGARFVVLRPHARGGLGEVFVARDEELHREVALKEIQAQHAEAAESRTRFLHEAEVTGQLEHPGIVPVYGLGSYADGRPYYAMRLIRGVTLLEAIARYHRDGATAHGLSLRQLLGRFLAVCHALAYAHSRGVIHRDLKPANVMLGDYGETLVVDWGLAKRMGDEEASSGTEVRVQVTGDSDLTQAGRVLGTPAYMSPEQAAGRLELLGPASDVYGLGATLYHLLTGRPPVEQVELGEALRKAERGDFPRPRQLRPDVPVALELVCLKAMAPRREERYPTARALADDLERWLADEPVSAGREPLRVRAGRWVRRRRLLVTAAAVLLVLAVPLAVALAVVSDRARRQADDDRDRIAEEQQKADRLAQRRQKVSEFYEKHLLAAARPAGVGLGRDISLREALDKASEGIPAAFGDEPEDEAAVSSNLGHTYLSLGENARAEKLLRRAYELRVQLHGPDDREALREMARLGDALVGLNRLAEVRELLKANEPRARRVFGEQSRATLSYRHNEAALLAAEGKHKLAVKLYQDLTAERARLFGEEDKDTIESRYGYGWCLKNVARYAEAVEVLTRTLDQMNRQFKPDHPRALLCAQQLASALLDNGEAARAEQRSREVLPRLKRVLGEDHPWTLTCEGVRAQALQQLGRTKEAEVICRGLVGRFARAFGPEHPEALSARAIWAMALGMAGEPARAEKIMRELLPVLEKIVGPEHRYYLTARHNLASALFEQGKATETVEVLQGLIPLRRRLAGEDNPDTLASQALLGAAWNMLGKFQGAEALYRDTVLPRMKTKLGAKHPDYLMSLNNYSFSLVSQRRFKEALAAIDEALADYTTLHGPDHLLTLRVRHQKGFILNEQGRFREGEAVYREIVPKLRKALSPEDPMLLAAEGNWGTALLLLKQHADAEQVLAPLYPALRKVPGPHHVNTLMLGQMLLVALTAQGKWVAAEPIARQQLAALEQKPGPPNLSVDDVRATLAQALLMQQKYEAACGPLRLLYARRADRLRPSAGQRQVLGLMLGWALLETGQTDEALRLLREVLEARQRQLPRGHWQIGSAESLVGDCLRRRGEYERAEKLLLSGHAALTRGLLVPPARVQESNARIAALYTAWGKKDRLEAWMRPGR